MNTKFLIQISKCKDPVIFLGVCTTLGVSLLNDSKETRPFEELLDEALLHFEALPRKTKKEVLKILKKANG
jgi:hypothetical protein